MPDKQTKTAHLGRHSASNSALLSQAVAAKLEDGKLRAAIRILISEDSPESPSLASLSKLQEKHPPASGMLLPSRYPNIYTDETEVRKAVLSFHAGSSGGLGGLRPHHLRDLLQCRESGSDFLSALTAFVIVNNGDGWTLST